MRQKAITLLVFLMGLFSFANAETLPRDVREKIIRATVMLLPTGQDGKLDGTRGSGSLISPLGYILTNYHVVGDPDNRELSEWIQIRTVRFVDKEPEFMYWGQVVAADPNLDLAIVKIAEDKDEKPVGNLNLPYVELGDSNNLTIGDPIFVFGFQGTGGMTLSFSQGSVGGFTGEDLESSGKQWVKHDAQTGPGNSGGGAFDDTGALVGVHTAGVAGSNNSRTSFLRPLALAWGLITPNVPKFVVRGKGSAGTGGSTSSGTGAGGSSSGATGGAGSVSAGSGNSGKWPPALAVGQNWQVALKGQNLAATWAVALTEKDSDGDPKGTATNGNQKQTAFMYYDPESDRVWVDLTKDGKSTTSCAFDKDGVKTPVWAGRAYYFKDQTSDGERIGDCTASLKGGTQAQGSGQSGGTQGSGSQGGGGQSGSAGSLTWPMNPQLGQTWEFNIQTQGIWKLVLKERSTKGNPTGTATSNKGQQWTGFFYYSKEESSVWLDLTEDGDSYLGCQFLAGSIKGKTMTGTAYYFPDDTADGEKIGSCTATLK